VGCGDPQLPRGNSAGSASLEICFELRFLGAGCNGGLDGFVRFKSWPIQASSVANTVHRGSNWVCHGGLNHRGVSYAESHQQEAGVGTCELASSGDLACIQFVVCRGCDRAGEVVAWCGLTFTDFRDGAFCYVWQAAVCVGEGLIRRHFRCAVQGWSDGDFGLIRG